MGFGQSISSGFSKYFTWSGRASRSEFWYWILFTIIVSIVAWILDSMFGLHVYKFSDVGADGGMVMVQYASVGWIQTFTSLLLFLPTIAVTVRRLHDTDHSGWWWWLQLLNFLCFIGTLILIFGFWIKPGDPAENRYGPPPTTT
ncbi:MAG: DUF805 domain-containing protein [Candidatus Nanopelagicales bacterium]